MKTLAKVKAGSNMSEFLVTLGVTGSLTARAFVVLLVAIILAACVMLKCFSQMQFQEIKLSDQLSFH